MNVRLVAEMRSDRVIGESSLIRLTILNFSLYALNFPESV